MPVDALCIHARKFLTHDAHKDSVLRTKAAAEGLRLNGAPQLNDPTHLEFRLASLRLDPNGHPHRGDSRVMLALRGVAASRRARLPPSRRALLAAWFLIAGLLPARIALRAIAWKMVPATRPLLIDRHAKRLRRLLNSIGQPR